MSPLPAMLTLEHSVAAAVEIMDAMELSYLVIGAPATGRLLGIIVQENLLAECAAEGHDPEFCQLVKHLDTDFDFCLETETVAELFEQGSSGLAQSTEASRGKTIDQIPMIVVDEFKVPVGLLERPE